MALNDENSKIGYLKSDNKSFFKIGLDPMDDIKPSFDISREVSKRQNEFFGWLSGLEDYDKVMIEKRDGRKIEATARREVTMHEMSLENTFRANTSLWFTDIRINGEDITANLPREGDNDEN